MHLLPHRVENAGSVDVIQKYVVAGTEDFFVPKTYEKQKEFYDVKK